MAFRSAILPVASLGSHLWMYVFFAGLIMVSMGQVFGSALVILAIILFTGVVLFQLITLPVEFNASRRAATLLTNAGIVTESEAEGAKKVLNAAALTYLAAALQGILTLLYLLSRRRR